MTDDGKQTSPDREQTGRQSSRERAQTDESLLSERHKADQALEAKRSEAQGDADLVVRRARKTADAVLFAAREKADERVDQTEAHAFITAERVLEDATLRDERASADESLQREREAIAALAILMPMEREKTDRYLLTERTRSDDDLSHRDDFLGIVSHDLRNLLSGIVLSTSILSEQAGASEQGKRTLEVAARIQRYAARMNRLIGDLVDVASIDAGKLSVTLVPGDTSALIDEVKDMFEGLALDKGLSLEIDTTEQPLLANFDHDRMVQVLANLITNAIKFTRSGTIVVRNERTADGCVISVRDTGLGIPDDKLETVFERFWQVGKNDRRGVGLGLYISRCIIEAHGGTIRATSTLGTGTTFSFTLTT
ncbi:MAG TPA: ATP-binding protein [Kofleriaceae bacterium]|jgi:signal transduction histidine kinase